MNASPNDTARPLGLRVLIVDDEADVRNELAELIRRWGHQPYIAQGIGAALLNDAIAQARAERCHVAIVDMRLLDAHNRDDVSGLELVPRLKPAESIIYSANGDRKTAIKALKDYNAFTFVGKQDSSRELRAALEEAARSVCAGGTGPQIEWGHLPGPDPDQPARQMLDQLLTKGEESSTESKVPPDQVGQLLGLLFVGKPRVSLLPIADDEGGASPSADATLRRSSRVFEAIVENEGRHRVVKLARKDKINNEVERYRQHVKDKMPGAFYAELQSAATLWDIGGVVYNYIGAGNRLTMLRQYYHQHNDPQPILRPLKTFFDAENWGHFYRNGAMPLSKTLFAAYDELWKYGLSKQFNDWREHDGEIELPHFGRALPNPMRWLARNYARAFQLRHLRQAITHGDLHSDNLFVSDSHAFPIDFERTGYGPILRDFVELIQDLSTRVAWVRGAIDSRPDLPLIYNLAVAWCKPDEPAAPLPLTRLIAADAAASKLHDVVQGLARLARERAHYEDQRELLWGMLLNNLFVANRLQPGSDRWLRTMLFAAVICGRLESWEQPQWPRPEWPQVDWR